MKNAKGAAQRRGIAYEKRKVADHHLKHIGGPGNPDGQKGRSRAEVKNWSAPVTKPVVQEAVRKHVNKLISKRGFTQPAIDYAKNKPIRLYKGPKRVS